MTQTEFFILNIAVFLVGFVTLLLRIHKNGLETENRLTRLETLLNIIVNKIFKDCDERKDIRNN